MSRGTSLAVACAQRLGKPHLILDLDADGTLAQAAAWLDEREGQFVLSIGGPRESEAPGIYAKAREFLRLVFDRE
jgi:hypothetical protein